MRTATPLPRTLRRALLSSLALLPLAVPAAAQPATLVRDVNPGLAGSAASSSPGDFFVFGGKGGKLLFSADVPGSGRELWASDGTAVGTELLADLCPGDCSGSPSFLGSTPHLAYFTSGGLWRTDGTRSGTFSLPVRFGGSFAALGEQVFFSGCEAATGCELWTSDGTPAGTRLFADLWPGARSGYPQVLLAVGGRFFFLGPSPSGGRALWRSDGTAAGTRLLWEVPDPVHAPPRLFAVAAGRLFFLAPSGGAEQIWASDAPRPAPSP